jgi:ribose 5-phosphate isomerase A
MAGPVNASIDPAKQAAGHAAAELVEAGMTLGLGTGSTVAYLLEALGRRRLTGIRGLPTSEATAAIATSLGIELVGPGDVDRLDLAIDGADEFDDELTATKGGGGALLREKVVASMADRFVLVATPDKHVRRLGDSFPLPVEVVPFAREPVRRSLVAEGYEVTVRTGDDGPTRTDNGNELLDVRFPDGIEDPAVMDLWLATLPGVVTSGLFVELATAAILGRDDGSVEHRTPAERA